MMTIDEAIRHCEEVAGEQQERADSAELIDILDGLDVEACKECAADHRQLAEWLRELKELREVFSKVDAGAIKPKDYLDLLDEWAKARKLLKAAVEGLDNCADKCICDYCDSRCPFYNFGCVSGWKHRDEALALIGEDGDANG